jgi:hypothetical protein
MARRLLLVVGLAWILRAIAKIHCTATFVILDEAHRAAS